MLKNQDFPLRQPGNCAFFFPQTPFICQEVWGGSSLAPSPTHISSFLILKKNFLPLCLSIFPFPTLSAFFSNTVLSQKTETTKCTFIHSNWVSQMNLPATVSSHPFILRVEIKIFFKGKEHGAQSELWSLRNLEATWDKSHISLLDKL